MSKSRRPLAVNRSDYLQALTLRAARIHDLVVKHSRHNDLNSAGVDLLKRCAAAAQDDLDKASKED